MADAGFDGKEVWGDETRLGGGYLWERQPWTAMARALLELIAYGLKVRYRLTKVRYRMTRVLPRSCQGTPSGRDRDGAAT